jgi:hypothetical protein
MSEVHVGFFRASSAFTMVAGRASSNNIRPNMKPPLIPRLNVVYSKTPIPPAAILARVIIPSEYLAAC